MWQLFFIFYPLLIIIFQRNLCYNRLLWIVQRREDEKPILN
nr:MAG TPA: hypothetical protein [Caudoviricetes sp.]